MNLHRAQGLDYPICKAIAGACGGSVGFKSMQGQGLTFWAILPCRLKINHPKEQYKQSSSSFASSEKPTKNNGTEKKKTILVVEDNQYNYHLLEIILNPNYNVIHSKNGQEAVELVRKQPVDLILMDLKMPVMDGLTASREIRTFNTQIPIIALTAHAFKPDRDLAIQAGCNDYLVKPVKKTLYNIIEIFCRMPQKQSVVQ